MNPAGPSPIPIPGEQVPVEAQPRPLVSVANLSAGFGEQQILHDVSFDVPAHQTLVILGQSGCGKTTLLRAIAGLVDCTGRIELQSRDISRLLPRERDVIYLDQEPLLFEHLTVRGNVEFAMRLRKLPEQEIRSQADSLLAAVDLVDHAGKREWQLSGGQKQRVAFARAILARPRLLLLDEPFCSLDGNTRSQMQKLFARISQEYGLTSIFVTHDVKEALVVGNLFARMSAGRLSIYPSRESFISDKSTGIPDEMEFWNAVRSGETPPQ